MEQFMRWVRGTVIGTLVILALVIAFAAVLAFLLVTMGGEGGDNVNDQPVPGSLLPGERLESPVGWECLPVGAPGVAIV